MLQGRPHFCSIQKAKLSDLGVSRDYALLANILPGSKKPSLRSDIVMPTESNMELAYKTIVGNSKLVFFDLETREDAVSVSYNKISKLIRILSEWCSVSFRMCCVLHVLQMRISGLYGTRKMGQAIPMLRETSASIQRIRPSCSFCSNTLL